MKPPVPETAPEFVRSVTGKIIEGKGDSLPVSAMPADGTWPTGTTQYEKLHTCRSGRDRMNQP
ncbi:MAG: hypothetical protein ACLP6G_05630 [Terriglobales bacterium]